MGINIMIIVVVLRLAVSSVHSHAAHLHVRMQEAYWRLLVQLVVLVYFTHKCISLPLKSTVTFTTTTKESTMAVTHGQSVNSSRKIDIMHLLVPVALNSDTPTSDTNETVEELLNGTLPSSTMASEDLSNGTFNVTTSSSHSSIHPQLHTNADHLITSRNIFLPAMSPHESHDSTTFKQLHRKSLHKKRYTVKQDDYDERAADDTRLN
ncbi:hypothetical protein Q1695_003304 [Nippostrongylus brasiliensis]|nr:hypothetical protein Q1695_003304 [Nippostrongylus brasiliensis]